MRYKLYFLIGCFGLAYYCITAFRAPMQGVKNDPPKVTITTPVNNDKFKWNSIIRYNINVSDKEDGNSTYDEISINEVSLEVSFFHDVSKAEKYLSGRTANEAENTGLSLIKNSDCFTCHSAKNKLLGPSFQLIAKRYPYNEATINLLSKRVVNGSTGVWGTLPMPAHPAVQPGEAKQMLTWILKNNGDKDVDFLIGKEGVFRTKERPVKDDVKGVYVLTASYTDHGESGSMENRKYGQHSIILKNVD